MTKTEVIAAIGYKPTPIGGLTALGLDNGCGGVSATGFRSERGSYLVKRLKQLGAVGVMRKCRTPGAFHIIVQ